VKRQTTYAHKRFGKEALNAVHDHLMVAWKSSNAKTRSLSYKKGHEEWEVGSFGEFLAEMGNSASSYICIEGSDREMWLHMNPTLSIMSIKSPERAEIQSGFAVLEQYLEDAEVTLEEDASPEEEPKPTVFIGHGRSPLWHGLKDHLSDLHKIEVIAYEVGSRAGHSIRDILDEMLSESSMAFLVMTAEDELADGGFQPRANVIHETGLFQGRLGFAKAIVLAENETKLFSNLDGIQQIRFGNGNIRESFGDVLAAIRREFPGAFSQPR